MNSHRQLTTLIGLSIMILLSGCATDHVAENHEYMPHNKKSYVVRGHNYSFAIYNGEHRLLTHPVEDLLAEMKWRKSLDKPAISDIYVVSHGWNFTLATAMANYHNYMERIDAFMEKQKDSLANQDRCKPSVAKDKDVSSSCFQPYFIFINWTSTTRPTTDLAKAVLPFGMDSAVEPLTSVIDKVPLHTLTAWKQSLSASQNALGTHYPNHYLGKDWGMEPYGYLDRNLIQDADAAMGEDVPVSALIYKLIKQKQSSYPEEANQVSSNCDKPDPLSPNDDVCVPLTDTKLHLVGHSYGAKLVVLAGMEALRRMMLDEISSPITNSLESQRKNSPTADRKYVECTDINQDTNFKDSVWYKTGHRADLIGESNISQEIESRFIQEINKDQPCLEKVYIKYGNEGFFAIDSLVLFNPAFSPGELSYPVEFSLSAPSDTLRFIPRKAIVYTNSDYANGALFGVRDMFLNTQISQLYHGVSSDLYNSDGDKLTPIGKFVTHTPGVKQLFQAGFGVASFVYGVGNSLLGYGITSAINFPADFLHHIQTNTLDGLFEPLSDNDNEFESFGKISINTLDFFMPIKLTRLFSPKTHDWKKLPFFHLREEKEQGLFRLNRTGLGKTGINNLAEGRIFTLWGLNSYYTNTKYFGGESQDTEKPGYFSPDISAESFCSFVGIGTDLTFAEDYKKQELRLLRNKFFSFNASLVYDSWKDPVVGAHSDLRAPEAPDSDNCWNVSEECQRLEKRDYTFSFMFNFTKTNFEKTIKGLEKKEHRNTDGSTAQGNAL